MNMFKGANVTEENEPDAPFTFFSKDITFTLYLTFIIPSTIMHLIVFILIFFNKTLRLALHNYVILFTLFYTFIVTAFMVPVIMDSHRPKQTIRWSLLPCKIRSFIETLSLLAIDLLVAWASFERHLLIFHSNLFNIKWKKNCFHYMPPILISTYLFIFYIYGSFIYPCETQVDFVNNICYYGCQSRDSLLGMWQTYGHAIFPTICVLICNSVLLFRVYRSKTRLQRSIDWRKYRIMILQLVCIAILYLSTKLPFGVAYIWIIIAPTPTVSTVWARLGFLIYIFPPLFPFVCLSSIPELRLKIKKILRRRAIAPVNFNIQPKITHPTTTPMQ